MSRMHNIGIFSGGVAVLSAVLFYAIPGVAEKLGFSGVKFLAGEVWRFVTFSFAHVSQTHLLENIISLLVAFFLATEIEVVSVHYIAAFFGAGLVVAILNVLAFPTLLMAGASVGIYATYGALSARGSPYVSRKVLVPILAVPVLAQFVLKALSGSGILVQILLHSVGFAFGVVLLFIISKHRPAKERVFALMEDS